MGSNCCFSPFAGRTNGFPDDEEGSVDSEPYSPKNLEFLHNLANVESAPLGEIEEGQQPGCPPPSPTQEIERDTDRSKTTASTLDSNSLAKALESKRNAHIYRLREKVSESVRSPGFASTRTDGCASPANTENSKTDNKSSAMKHIGKEHSSKVPGAHKSGALFTCNTSFRWEHDYEEPYRMDRSPDREFTTNSSVKKCASLASSPPSGHLKETDSQNGQTDMKFMDDCETGGCYIHVTRTGQRILNHHQLRPFMDELKIWSMQVPGTTTLRYKHMTTGLDVSLPWPDLRTGSTQEIGKFVDTVNRIEGRKVFYSLCMENYKSGPPCVPPPSPTSVTKNYGERSLRSRFSKSRSGHRK